MNDSSDCTSNRLEKIESKLDRLSEAVVSIARIEERVTTVLKQNDRLFSSFDDLSKRVEIVETKSNVNQKTITFAERFVWVVISAVIAAVMYNMH
jgi:predicted nuclease with TOPRIM domain